MRHKSSLYEPLRAAWDIDDHFNFLPSSFGLVNFIRWDKSITRYGTLNLPDFRIIPGSFGEVDDKPKYFFEALSLDIGHYSL